MKKLALAIFVALLLPAGASAWDRSFQPAASGKINFDRVTSIEMLGWQSSLGGNIQVEGTPVNLDEEAGIGAENRLGLRVSHVLSEKSALELSYMHNDHTGYIEKNVTFEKKNYAAGAQIRLQNTWFDVAYLHNLTSATEADKEGRELFYLDGIVGVKFSEAEINVAGRTDPVKVVIPGRYEENWNQTFPLPYLGLAAGGQIADNIWLKGQVKYFRVNAGGYEASHADYGVNAALRMNPKATDIEWFVDLGYRGVRYDLETNGDKAELRYTGPTLGLFARF